MKVNRSIPTPNRSKLTFRPPPAARFTAAEEVDLFSPSEGQSRTPARKGDLWKRAGQALALGGCLAAGLMAPMAPMISNGAPTTVSQTTKVELALKNGSVRRLYDSLPSNIRSIAGNLSDAQAKVLKNGASGHSKVGPITVNHRKAFIKGTVLGRSIWSNVKEQISDARAKHHLINRAEERELHTLIDRVARLKSSQRKTMVQLLDHVRL